MNEWSQSAEGRWILRLDGRSLSLPDGFELDDSFESETALTGITSANEMSWVFREHLPDQDLVDKKVDCREYKVLGMQTVSGLNITELAPTTPSGRAQARVRIHVIQLTPVDSLIVIGGGESFVRSLAEQWAASERLGPCC